MSEKPVHISPILRHLVKHSVALLGNVIEEELGKAHYLRIERIRKKMVKIREQSPEQSVKVLEQLFTQLRKLPQEEKLQIARAFTLMLEMMNACENAYRSFRIKTRPRQRVVKTPDSIIYVLTAHPTEARSPENIWVFHEIQKLLVSILEKPQDLKTQGLSSQTEHRLKHWLLIAWKTPIVKKRKPRIHDEAEHIYSTLLRDETLRTLLSVGKDLCPVFVRSWVGGDKDGHPGVTEHAFIQSLSLSRRMIQSFILRRLAEIQAVLIRLESPNCIDSFQKLRTATDTLGMLQTGDGKIVQEFQSSVYDFKKSYLQDIGEIHPSLEELCQLIQVFPALVVPLEFRESSEILREIQRTPSSVSLPKRQRSYQGTILKKAPAAMERMIAKLARVSQGGDPRWYVRGLIISMTENIDDILAGASLVKKHFGAIKLPIIPLFEQANALHQAPQVVQQVTENASLASAIPTYWGNYLEVMVGYSDSSKENGVLPSRLAIATALQAVERTLSSISSSRARSKNQRSSASAREIIPLFFHGSGGSIDRGGGTIQDQTAWWPKSALNNYKVTVQGEMVERSLASPEIIRSQIETIAASVGIAKQSANPRKAGLAYKAHPCVQKFSDKVAANYRKKISSSTLLDAVEKATPYRFLSVLRLGSRPSKRSSGVSVDNLRAIPWVLCWTQTRALFVTWWGVGSAWEQTSTGERKKLIAAYRSDPLFATFVRALGFTLSKVELPVWKLYLTQSSLPRKEAEEIWTEFKREYEKAYQFTQAILKSKSVLGWKPWLEESIHLRAPMIHPLNLLQIIALQDKDFELLRTTVVGISSGMLTTG